MSETQPTRREFLQKAMYVPPAILTLVAIPSFASAGSGSGTGGSTSSAGGSGNGVGLQSQALQEDQTGPGGGRHRRRGGLLGWLFPWLPYP